MCVITVKGETKKAKRTCVVEPLQEGEELSETTSMKWRLAKLLGQNEPELIYAGQRSNSTGFIKVLVIEGVMVLGSSRVRVFVYMGL